MFKLHVVMINIQGRPLCFILIQKLVIDISTILKLRLIETYKQVN